LIRSGVQFSSRQGEEECANDVAATKIKESNHALTDLFSDLGNGIIVRNGYIYINRRLEEPPLSRRNGITVRMDIYIYN
jgi:hypothetical protein